LQGFIANKHIIKCLPKCLLKTNGGLIAINNVFNEVLNPYKEEMCLIYISL